MIYSQQNADSFPTLNSGVNIIGMKLTGGENKNIKSVSYYVEQITNNPQGMLLAKIYRGENLANFIQSGISFKTDSVNNKITFDFSPPVEMQIGDIIAIEWFGATFQANMQKIGLDVSTNTVPNWNYIYYDNQTQNWITGVKHSIRGEIIADVIEDLPSIYGAQYVPDVSTITEPQPVTVTVTKDKHYVKIVQKSTGINVYEDYLTPENIKIHQNDPRFDVIFLEEPIMEPEPEPEPTWSGWVTKPSGIIEYMTMTISTKQTLEGQGWVFTTDKPVTPQPENENISIIFYTGTGGDLKTHFNINSIIVTPEEKEELAGWLYQNYGTSIILAVNRLTNDIRTHTAQQVKAYVLQKIQDDTPEPVLPTPTTPTTPPTVPPTVTGKSGIMGAGVAGAIALLILGGFIIDSRSKK